MHWGYYFYLGGGLSTVDTAPAHIRSRLRSTSIVRMKAINDVVDKIAGDKKPSMSVLDFASNWGGMAVDMGHRGFARVGGFDFKPGNVERANALSAYMGMKNVEFECANVYNLPRQDSFDVVLNLGLLYHVSDPVGLAQITYDLTREFAVFDTLAHKEPFSGYVQGIASEDQLQRPGMGEQRVELHPTYRGLIALILFAGFKKLVEVVVKFSDDIPDRDINPYFTNQRRIILAFKRG
jgi:SAM-dependent methyltransferase